jgi:hypothetical protein
MLGQIWQHQLAAAAAAAASVLACLMMESSSLSAGKQCFKFKQAMILECLIISWMSLCEIAG